MKHRKALVSEEELDKVKASKRASETCEQTLHRQEQNQTRMISTNTYYLACTEGSALQCCSLHAVIDYNFRNEPHVDVIAYHHITT